MNMCVFQTAACGWPAVVDISSDTDNSATCRARRGADRDAAADTSDKAIDAEDTMRRILRTGARTLCSAAWRVLRRC